VPPLLAATATNTTSPTAIAAVVVTARVAVDVAEEFDPAAVTVIAMSRP
jgi:hypothetical protein